MQPEAEALWTIEVKPYTSKELYNLYQVPRRTMEKWLKPFREEIGKRTGQWYTVKQVAIIFEKLGVPHLIKEAV